MICIRAPLRKAGDVVLEVKHLAGESRPVDANLSLRAGEVLGIAGLIGAGPHGIAAERFSDCSAIKSGEIRVAAYVGLGIAGTTMG